MLSVKRGSLTMSIIHSSDNVGYMFNGVLRIVKLDFGAITLKRLGHTGLEGDEFPW